MAEDMVRGWRGRAVPLPRRSATLASWSLVQVELDALRAVLRQSAAEHIAVLSGACYPLVSGAELHRQLTAWAGRSYLMSVPIPFTPWNTPRHQDGGTWRFTRRFVLRGDDVVFVAGVPLRWPGRRQVPEGLRLRASSQWKIYARHHAELLLRIVDTRPDVVAFWRRTLVPDESFAASVLSSPTLAGVDAAPLCHGHAWYQQWTDDRPDHPDWLRVDDFDRIAAARRGPVADPVVLQQPGPMPQALFARKFSSETEGGLIDRIDAELRA
ncbi:beta-1,6-N-acetylglucosaminyltransferase [Kineococcus vitellinus]|uniref:beta-1,6-N-acetylglucosaminyltransferase n=1 Tax=Kineococcus vitellinus TaxID=2696565 RepID=UPI00196B94D8